MTARSSTSSREADLRLEIVRSDDWADVVATSWMEFLRQVPDARLCLPTGDTPRPMYRRFAESHGDLSASTVILLDEFGLEPQSRSRCDVMIRHDLVERLSEAPKVLHTIDTESADLERECGRYEALVRDGGLDLAILGLGLNGHLGLNEPGSELKSTTRVVQLTHETADHAKTYGSDAPMTWGVTLGIDSLLAANELWLLVTGESKAEILARTLTDAVGPDLPATYLRLHDNVTLFVDEEAAALL